MGPFPGASRPSRGSPGAFQGPPGASRGLDGAACGSGTSGGSKNAPAAYRQSLELGARLKFHAGWSGWTRPPTMAGTGGVGPGGVKGGVEGVFKGIAGCLGEFRPSPM